MTDKIKKVSIIVNDLSGSVAIRAYILAEAIKKLKYEVEIIGFLFNGELFAEPPSGISPISIPGRIYPAFFMSARDMLKRINGDIIYALKPRPSSFGVALLKKMLTHCPVIVDIDDWEMGWYGGDTWRYRPTIKQFYNDLFRGKHALRHPDFPLYIKWMEKLVARADAITVHSAFLKERFGGTYLPNGKNTALFDPSRFNQDEVRKRYGLSGFKVLMFAGVPRPHKGLEDVLNAVEKLRISDLRLVLVGENPYDDYTDTLTGKWGRWIIKLPRTPFEKMPEVLSAAHVIIIPQRDTESARAQFPLKLTDGMAMAKPILSTRVGDIPEILGDTGYLVEPGNVDQLAEKIEWIFKNYNEAVEAAKKARERCVNFFSIDKMSGILNNILGGLKDEKTAKARSNTSVKTAVRVYWDTTRACNFRCPYCFYNSEISKGTIVDPRFNYEKVISFFRKLPNIESVEITGGEPFLLPDFVKICAKLTEFTKIYLITNLSSPGIYQFARSIDPRKVKAINCSLHITERERLGLVDDFIGKFHILKEKGFTVYAVQVMWPPVLERFDSIREKFFEKGIVIHPGVFRGKYKGKTYPAAYSSNELRMLNQYETETDEQDPLVKTALLEEIDMDFLESRKHGEISFKGLPCLSGMASVRILPSGELVRCASDNRSLGNIYKGNAKLFTKAMPCRVDICHCAWEGSKHAQGKPRLI